MDKIKKYAPLAALVLGVIAVIMIFLPSVVVEVMGESESWNGFVTAFGNEDEGFKLGFMNLLNWLILIGGVVCAFLSWKKPEKKLFAYIAIAALLVAGIFFFCTVAFTNLDGVSKEVAKEVKKFMDLGAGAIIAGICSILSALCVATPVVLDYLKK